MQTQREMGRAFSVDEVSDQFWSERPRLPKPGEPHMMSRSESEWAFQRFLQERASPEAKEEAAAAGNPSAEGGGDDNDVVEIKDPSPDRNEEPSQDRTSGNNVSGDANSNNTHRGKTTTNPLAFNAGGENIPIDSEEYQAFLKSKLNLACAAVALSRVLSLPLHSSLSLSAQRLRSEFFAESTDSSIVGYHISEWSTVWIIKLALNVFPCIRYNLRLGSQPPK